jgi:RNA polymerase sigma factor (sigma-70 family)
MATAQPGMLLRQFQRLVAGGSPPWTDRQLLDDFARRRDETAFAALVSRHGPMVLRVCRRVLGNHHDAEDAFQATFLVLAQHGGSIRQREALAGWLYGVAYRTALAAKRSAARRRYHEARVVPPAPPAAASPSWGEVQAALDEELQRLPERFRSAFVLHVLEGKSGPEAAAELGCKEGTLKSRVSRARRSLQRQLARRGILLAALLAALAVTEGAGRAALPVALARATVRFGLLAAARGMAAGTIPPRVASLARGVTRTLFLGKAKVVTTVLIAACLVAGALTHQALASREVGGIKQEAPRAAEATAPKREAKPPRQAAASDRDAVTFTGRVLGPDDEPFAGATLSVWCSAAKREVPRRRETTGRGGSFRITVRRADLEAQAVLVATAEGYGPDWTELRGSTPKDRNVTLRLVRDDVPINGRLLSLEGRGIAGVQVHVRRVEKREDGGDLAAFIATKRQWARGNYVNGPAMKNVRAEALPGATSATTDADGRFRLTGFGRERVVHLTIYGKAVETAYVEVLTRTGPVTGLFTGNENDTAYGATFERVCAPSKPVVGTVREKGTGKPLAGITVFCGRRTIRTDARGRYRIDGLRKQHEYSVTAQGPPYFGATKSPVADTPDFEPLRVDLELERGLALRGRLFDSATGKPVQGTVTYHAFADNPHLKNVSGLDRSECQADADGSFAVTGLPGPGLLEVLADEDDFVKVKPAADWKLVPGINSAPPVAHALVRIDPPDRDAPPAPIEIALEPAAAVKATVVGPDGKPFTGYYAAGQTASPRSTTAAWMMPQDSPTFTVRGLDGSRRRTVVVFSAEKRLGKAQVVRADETGPVTLRLEPLSGWTGRVLGAGGRPWAGLHVRAVLSRRGADGERLPVQFFITRGTWAAALDRETTTDAQGRFRLDGLLPGLKYTFLVSEDASTDTDSVKLRREGILPPEAGRQEDLGDIRMQQTKEE